MTTLRPDIILASASHSRRTLLETAGVEFRTIASDVDEAALKRDHAKADFGDLAVKLATAKALAVANHHGDALVIGADQVLVLDGEAFDKPDNLEVARRQLLRLRGRSHELATAVACAKGNEVLWSQLETPRLSMRNFSSDWLETYLAAEGESVTQTVGGYKVEGLGIQLFEGIAGDYFAVLGLPLLSLLAFLRAEGAVAT